MANAGHLSTSRFRLPACAPNDLASMVAKLMAPLCFCARGLSSSANSARSSGVSAKMYASGIPALKSCQRNTICMIEV